MLFENFFGGDEMDYHTLTCAQLFRKRTAIVISTEFGKEAQEMLDDFMREKPRHLDIQLRFNLYSIRQETQQEEIIRLSFDVGDIIRVVKN